MEPIDRVFIMKALTSSEGQAAIKAMTGPDAYAYFLALVCSAPAVDPIRAAGGCYCRECKHWFGDDNSTSASCDVDALVRPRDHSCGYGEPMEAQDNG